MKYVFFLSSILFFSFSNASELEAISEAKNRIEILLKNATLPRHTQLKNELSRSFASITQLESLFKTQLSQCKEAKSETDFNCAEGNNKNWNQFSSLMGSLTDVGSMAMSATCSKLANALKMGQAAQVAIRGTCAFRRSSCIEKCELAEKTFLKIKKEISNTGHIVRTTKEGSVDTEGAVTTKSSSDTISCEKGTKHYEYAKGKLSINEQMNTEQIVADCINNLAEIAHDLTKIHEDQAGKFATALTNFETIGSEFEFTPDDNSPTTAKRVCNNSANEAISKVTMNLSTLMMSMQKNTACAQDLAKFDDLPPLDNCILTGTCPAAEVPNECLDPANKDAIYCKTPTTTAATRSGSGGGVGSMKPTTPDFSVDTNNLSGLSMDGLGGGAGTDGTGAVPNLADTPGSKSAGVPGGGGGGGLSIPGGGGGANPNRGGGGRGVSSDSPSAGSPSYSGSGNFASSSAEKRGDDLKDYLPGGAKDPSLSKIGGPEGITASSGPTIFEKVSKGYKNNRSTLIPE